MSFSDRLPMYIHIIQIWIKNNFCNIYNPKTKLNDSYVNFFLFDNTSYGESDTISQPEDEDIIVNNSK